MTKEFKINLKKLEKKRKRYLEQKLKENKVKEIQKIEGTK